MIDAPDGLPVTLTITSNGVPQSGVLVFVGDDGKLDPGISLTTDANGVISTYLVSPYGNAVVTAVNPFGPLDANKDELFTFEKVESGDHLVLAQAPLADSQITVTFPTDPGASSYRLHTNCGAADVASGGTITLRGCGATLDALLESRDASGTSRAWLYQADVTVATALALTGTYQPAVTEHLSFTTGYVISPDIGIQARLATSKGIVYSGSQITMPISYMNNAPTYDLVRPTIPAGTALTDVRWGYSAYSDEHIVDWHAESSLSHAFDLDHTGLEYAASPVTYDRASRYLWYPYSGGYVLTDMQRFTVDFTRTGDRSWRWHMIAPYKTRGPTLPTQPHDWNASSADSATVIDATFYSAPGGYAAFRANGFAIDPTIATTGAEGRLYYETL